MLKLLGELSAAFGEDGLKGGAHLVLCVLAKIHELVEGVFAEDVVVNVGHDGTLAKNSLVFQDAQVNDLVTDASAAVHFVEGGVQECAEGDVLQRELTISSVGNPGAHGAGSGLCFNHQSR